ncbi:hypothetical protein EW145_g372 [Phellinidium pouzarii]|uniref:alpha-1,2-Mannosidase n=1 Tax=Phellinidium pouzarii TaxID=167371 RepID=A0A4S4LP40_9AGAM|nr:hypothetical protein EW145_g372 [Phellinidium pouzarii]
MLPLHRETSVRRGGWRDMLADSPSDSSAGLRLFSIIRFKSMRRISRTAFILFGGALICLWLIATRLGPTPFLGRPFSHPHPPSPYDFGIGYDVLSPGGKPDPVDWQARAEKVKEAFLHAYHGYEQYASPADELLPLSNTSINNFNGWSVTTVDSLDTMYLMGLHDEFERGLQLVEGLQFTTQAKMFVPFFETVIRYLGGLLSAYALSHDTVLLKRADELGAALLPAFNTPSGFPAFAVNPATGANSGGVTGWLAEIASCMMEYKYLAKLTGKKEYYDAANTVMRRMYDANLTLYPEGLLPTLWNLSSGQPVNDQVSIGAMADSAFEYFLKQYLLTNQTEAESLSLYLRTMRGIIDNNLFLSPKRSLLYVTDIHTRRNMPSRKFEHLACFLPGLLALGAEQLPSTAFAPYSDLANSGSTPSELERHMWAASGLAVSCGTMYTDMPTGLGADEVVFKSLSEIERTRWYQEKQIEAERLRAEILRKEKAGKGARSPPVLSNGKMEVRPKPPPSVNQTAEDEKLLWANVLSAWREGRYDGSTNHYIDANGKEEAGGVYPLQHAKTSGIPKGPVPGLRDPPLDAPEESELRDYRRANPTFQLRPEVRFLTIESLFIMWRTTGEKVWRERGWAAFEAIEEQTRTQSGYATIRDVSMKPVVLTDSMPSFFLAETLKYLYLLFSDESLLPLDKFVLNTEAHPFPVFEWTEWEKTKFGITT